MASEQGRQNSNVVPVSRTYINTPQELIMITKDRAELCLMRHAQRLEQRRSWIAPLSLFIPVLAALVASDFKAAYGLDAATWHAMFVLVALIALGWLVVAAARAWRSPATIKNLLDELANEPTAVKVANEASDPVASVSISG